MCNDQSCRNHGRLDGFKIDACMVPEILDLLRKGTTVLSCCCGHDRYKKTIVVQEGNGTIKELFTQKLIPRKKKFYRRDSEGFYFIPEVDTRFSEKVSY